MLESAYVSCCCCGLSDSIPVLSHCHNCRQLSLIVIIAPSFTLLYGFVISFSILSPLIVQHLSSVSDLSHFISWSCILYISDLAVFILCQSHYMVHLYWSSLSFLMVYAYLFSLYIDDVIIVSYSFSIHSSFIIYSYIISIDC